MSSVVALDRLLDARHIWRGQAIVSRPVSQPTGHAMLDAILPGGGWPESALSELLVAATGTGELRLLWPTLARLTAAGERVVLVAPPHRPCPQAWLAAGVDLRRLIIVQAKGRDALWSAEQCLRSGSCGAVLCWPSQADDRALRRLQIAAETGKTLAFAYRPLHEAENPSPAALRLAIEAQPAQLRVIKCRGGLAPARPLPASAWESPP
ncbi:translesion DNA synthesis-associated protein ImuA [Stutzerimonas stutzeri]|uniref:CDP-6-deoxy-delta-3,4-glucoseen reductase n=1 Tax=Stutzerimonas stutzeri KOS6 TaxID=1218352 RepID=A0A061JN69_STUST|nr:translesion DNA synthesis-associated protein ImuA [Stutzerimonas stutzeri]EWC39639.1 CDP-6-deoxy-delta-3,4-glucoseen reductase [Stutzerimonas stutzeri KOS6]